MILFQGSDHSSAGCLQHGPILDHERELGGTEKSMQHTEFSELPVLGDPAKREGKLIGWIVKAAQC
jgi:hypothetical protein